MNLRKSLVTVLLTLTAALGASGPGQAASGGGYQQRDPVERRQHRTPHSDRKAAAQRLKAEMDTVRHQHQFRTDGKPRGYQPTGFTGQGKSGTPEHRQHQPKGRK